MRTAIAIEEPAAKRMRFGYRRLLLVRERMPVDLEPGTGCIAKEVCGRGFNDDGQSREAIVLESRPSNLPVIHSRLCPSRSIAPAEPCRAFSGSLQT
jgi:hypothetical protein